ncbi:ABC transporter ATP-binding protein [Lactobacillus sp. YT155]|uniref:ABC transporter ATP-binding protein n=1 Tax=Lactobacillus sp. YT155 TaxID=3060955 RepID=UPI0026604AEB|nr:ABC transporter ATP-binding protein [Lactobacillus sp. YT155]MDO1604521.1 ABC transporter ATP-binding protein [Lactobacillus sp. YT155]
MTTIFKLTDITCVRNNQTILDEINLEVQKGTIYGFLGPNGAGKTTLMKVLLNLLQPNKGTIEVMNESIISKSYEYLNQIGSIIENPVFYNKLTVKENLALHCNYLGIYDLEKIDQKLKLVKMYEARDKKVKNLSLGMKQRLAIARALISEPELLVLDEPINGLDPFGIKEIRELLIQINRELGTTIFISSHIISEIEMMCDVIGFIQNGRIVREMTTQEIKNESKKYIELTVSNVKKAVQAIDSKLEIENFKVIDDKSIRIYDDTVSQKQIMEVFISNDIGLLSIEEKTGSLEEYFVKLINEGAKI